MYLAAPAQLLISSKTASCRSIDDDKRERKGVARLGVERRGEAFVGSTSLRSSMISKLFGLLNAPL